MTDCLLPHTQDEQYIDISSDDSEPEEMVVPTPSKRQRLDSIKVETKVERLSRMLREDTAKLAAATTIRDQMQADVDAANTKLELLQASVDSLTVELEVLNGVGN